MRQLIFFLLLLFGCFAKISSAQSCSGQLPQACLAPNNPCKYDFVNNVCYSGTANDTCQGYSNQTACSNGGCFFDTYLNRCLTSLYQVTTVFACPYWSNQQFLVADQYGGGLTSPACQFHACVFSNGICQVPTTAGNIYSFSQTTQIYAEQTLWINPTVIPNTLNFTVIAAEYIVQNQNQPSWSILRMLGPQTNLSQYYNYFNPNCSSYNQSASAGPQPFVATSNYPISTANITANFNNYNFGTDQIGNYLRQTFGYSTNGPSNLVTQVTTDGTYKYSYFNFDMVQKTSQCSAFGAARTVTSNSQVFYLPFAKIDRLIQNGYAEINQAFVVTVPTTGTATIGSVSNYHEQANAIEVSYYQDSCATGSSRQRITYQFNVRDVFDPTKVVGPRNISDILFQQQGSTTLNNCYGDALVSYTFQGCNYATGICSYQYQTQSRCRVITADGNAFKFCNGSSTADRIADMGSNIPYPSNLDGQHLTFINVYTCPSGGVCTLTNQSPNNVADPVSITISQQIFQTNVINASPFTVTAGFLATPTASISSYNALTNSSTGLNATQFFDGNVFSNQPMNPMILLASPASSKYDLRLRTKPGNITVYPVDIFGQIVTSSIPASLDWSQIAASTLYTTKNTFAQGCGALNACQTLPACSGVLGCDGFSVPTLVIKNLMPAVGYRYVMNFDVNSPDVNGNFAPGRVLLSMNGERKLLQTSDQDPSDNQRYGTVAFNIRVIDSNGTITEDVTQEYSNLNSLFESSQAHQTLLKCVLPLFVSGFILYFVIEEISYYYNYRKRLY